MNDDNVELEMSRPVDRAAIERDIRGMGDNSDNLVAIQNIEREFQEFLQEIVGQTPLERFRQEYEQTFELLKSSQRTEQEYIKKCLELNKRCVECANNVNAAIRLATNEADKIGNLQNNLEKAYEEVARAKVKEEESKQEIKSLKIDIANLKRQKDQITELEEDRKLKELKNEFEDLNKITNDQMEQLASLNLINETLTDEEKKYEAEITRMSDERDKYREDIANIQQIVKDMSQERKKLEEQKAEMKKDKKQERENKENKEIELKKSEETLDEKNQKKTELEANIKKLDAKDIPKLQNQLASKEEENKDLKRDLAKSKIFYEDMIQEKNREDGLLKDLREVTGERQKEFNERLKQAQRMKRKRDKAKVDEDILKINSQQEEEALERIKEEVDKGKKAIEDKLRERDLLNKEVVDKQNIARENESEMKNLENEFKKLENKIHGFKTNTENLNKVIKQLEKDKNKYGIEASQANAKYYQCMEKVKMKSTLITKLQKKNAEAEAKLKQQQNLYEAVRSDRNLYSKNLLEAQDEISELKMKFRRMTYQISQLKDEITSKDQAIQKERTALTRHQKENKELVDAIKLKESHINNLDQMIKEQDANIGRLKFVITEAEAEKQKQRKDYEMVINERDILGTQLIKRNEELALLYEKIKIQQSTLKKGEIYYQKRHEDILKLKQQIADIKKEIIVAQNETACIVDLKKEIYLLQKELLEQQQKEKILTQELEKPMNVHRWRKLECTEPETYEKIQKIQSLQKRLIAKTEEVQEKDVLIQEKEKLYVELKNILAKQSGPEVAEKLTTYQQNLKERSKQLKEMVSELKSYQSQVNAYRFEIERLDKSILDIKKQYFDRRRREIRNRPADGEIIEEEDEGDLIQDGYYQNRDRSEADLQQDDLPPQPEEPMENQVIDGQPEEGELIDQQPEEILPEDMEGDELAPQEGQPDEEEQEENPPAPDEDGQDIGNEDPNGEEQNNENQQ